MAVVAFAAGVATTALTDSVDWDEQQWGNAAEWAAGLGTVLTLLLGLVILARDHANAERAQVDLVGAWGEPTYEARGVEQPRVEQASILVRVRNASQLPVTVAQLAYTVHTRWLVPQEKSAFRAASGTAPVPCFLYNLLVLPDQTWDNKGHAYDINLGESAPPNASQLAPVDGVRCQIDWLLVVDNAGRKWEIRPTRGGRAKRIGKHGRPQEYQPPEFFGRGSRG